MPAGGELDNLRCLWGGDLDTGKSGLSKPPLSWGEGLILTGALYIIGTELCNVYRWTLWTVLLSVTDINEKITTAYRLI